MQFHGQPFANVDGNGETSYDDCRNSWWLQSGAVGATTSATQLSGPFAFALAHVQTRVCTADFRTCPVHVLVTFWFVILRSVVCLFLCSKFLSSCLSTLLNYAFLNIITTTYCRPTSHDLTRMCLKVPLNPHWLKIARVRYVSAIVLMLVKSWWGDVLQQFQLDTTINQICHLDQNF